MSESLDLTKVTSLHQERYNSLGGRSGSPADPSRCCVEVSDRQRWISYSQCARKRGYGPEGAYCKQHDPSAVKKRNDEREAAYAEERARQNKAWELQRLAPSMKATLESIRDGANDVRGLAAAVLAQFKHDGVS